jgi:hypothetical protein
LYKKSEPIKIIITEHVDQNFNGSKIPQANHFLNSTRNASPTFRMNEWNSALQETSLVNKHQINDLSSSSFEIFESGKFVQ